MICDNTGHQLAHTVLRGGAYCCAGMAAAVTASQGPNFQAAAKKIGTAAVVGYNGAIAGGKLVGTCVSGACRVVANKVRGHRSIDEDELSVREVNVPDEDENLIARFAEPEQEYDEDAVLVSRFAEPQPESDEDNLE